MSDRAEVLKFVQSHKLAVVATVDGQEPQAAVVGFGETPAFELVFGTYSSSRKYHNLKTNTNVAVVIGWDEGQTVQYEGVAEELTGPKALEYAEYYFQKNPSARAYAQHPEERYFKIKPTWARYTDLRTEPWRMIELDF